MLTLNAPAEFDRVSNTVEDETKRIETPLMRVSTNPSAVPETVYKPGSLPEMLLKVPKVAALNKHPNKRQLIIIRVSS